MLVSEYVSDDLDRQALVYDMVDYFAVEAFNRDHSIDLYLTFPGKSLRYAEDAAENFTLGIHIGNRTTDHIKFGNE